MSLPFDLKNVPLIFPIRQGCQQRILSVFSFMRLPSFHLHFWKTALLDIGSLVDSFSFFDYTVALPAGLHYLRRQVSCSSSSGESFFSCCFQEFLWIVGFKCLDHKVSQYAPLPVDPARSCSTPQMYLSVFFTLFGKFSAVISVNIFFCTFLPSPSGTPLTCMLMH